jgi:hypothetical protein
VKTKSIAVMRACYCLRRRFFKTHEPFCKHRNVIIKLSVRVIFQKTGDPESAWTLPLFHATEEDLAVALRYLDGTPRVQIHRDVYVRASRAESTIARSPNTVFERHGALPDALDCDFNLGLVAVNERHEKLRACIDGRKAYALTCHQFVIRDSAQPAEKFLHSNVAIMEDDRIINQPSRVAISEANRNARGERHKNRDR